MKFAWKCDECNRKIRLMAHLKKWQYKNTSINHYHGKNW